MLGAVRSVVSPTQDSIVAKQGLLHAGTGVNVLPWSEMDSLQLETGYIKDQLVALNKKGFLTINSQPCVNGQPSTDEKVGWGGPNGWVPLLPPRTACVPAWLTDQFKI